MKERAVAAVMDEDVCRCGRAGQCRQGDQSPYRWVDETEEVDCGKGHTAMSLWRVRDARTTTPRLRSLIL